MAVETMRFTIRYAGTSYDLRTNIWEVKCHKCSKEFKPPTTMMSTQQLTCPKCDTSEIVNWNDVLDALES